jgi:hypothetical protein
MGTVTTEALALRRTPFGETSQVAEFLTRDHGRVSLILKGVHRERSRIGGPVDLLDHARVTWFARRGSRSLGMLRERRVLTTTPAALARIARRGLWLWSHRSRCAEDQRAGALRPRWPQPSARTRARTRGRAGYRCHGGRAP